MFYDKVKKEVTRSTRVIILYNIIKQLLIDINSSIYNIEIMKCKVSVFYTYRIIIIIWKEKNLKLLLQSTDNLETKKSKSIDNKDNGKKDIEDNYNTSSGQYTFDSSDPKEIMTGIGEGEGGEKNNVYPDSDKYIVEDIKKVIKDENSGFGEEEEESSSKRGSEQSNNKDEWRY